MNFRRKISINSFYYVTIGIFTILLISNPGFASASSKGPYDSGYDHGCDDARISDSSDRYINQPEKGPSYHTSEFMNGYDAGFGSCSTASKLESTYQSRSPSQTTFQGTMIEDLCNQYYGALQLNGPCRDYVDGNELQGPINCILFSSGVVPSKSKKSKNLSILPIYFCLVTGDFIAYKYSDQLIKFVLFFIFLLLFFCSTTFSIHLFIRRTHLKEPISLRARGDSNPRQPDFFLLAVKSPVPLPG